MEGGLKELSMYRFAKAKEELAVSEAMLEKNFYKASINRSYYGIFHAMRAVTALEEFDTSKHSGVIAYFNQNFVKKSIFDKSASKIIKGASLLREKSDYQDFYIASKQEATQQLDNAKLFVSMVEDYLSKNEIE